jgi:hypothetical protein
MVRQSTLLGSCLLLDSRFVEGLFGHLLNTKLLLDRCLYTAIVVDGSILLGIKTGLLGGCVIDIGVAARLLVRIANLGLSSTLLALGRRLWYCRCAMLQPEFSGVFSELLYAMGDGLGRASYPRQSVEDQI